MLITIKADGGQFYLHADEYGKIGEAPHGWFRYLAEALHVINFMGLDRVGLDISAIRLHLQQLDEQMIREINKREQCQS